MIKDFIKGNLVLVICGLLVIAATAYLAVVIKDAMAKAKKYEEQVRQIRAAVEKFNTFQWALTSANVKAAEENRNLSEKEYRDLVDKLKRRYQLDPDSIPTNITAIAVKNLVRRICLTMENKLRGSDVSLPSGLTYFTFDALMNPDELPAPEEIPLILKQVQLINELVDLIARSRVHTLSTLARSGLTTTKGERYDYITYTLALDGDFDAIANFLNSLHDAKYFFVVRSLVLAASDPVPGISSPAVGTSQAASAPQPTTPQPGGGPADAFAAFTAGAAAAPVETSEPVYLRKRDRRVFEEPPTVKVQLIVDYLEFHEKE